MLCAFDTQAARDFASLVASQLQVLRFPGELTSQIVDASCDSFHQSKLTSTSIHMFDSNHTRRPIHILQPGLAKWMGRGLDKSALSSDLPLCLSFPPKHFSRSLLLLLLVLLCLLLCQCFFCLMKGTDWGCQLPGRLLFIHLLCPNS